VLATGRSPIGQRDWTRAKEEQWSLGMFTGCGQLCFLLKVHFCNSHSPMFGRSVAEGGQALGRVFARFTGDQYDNATRPNRGTTFPE
jgi:hypothetical protein